MSPNSEEPASVSTGAQTESVPIPSDALIIVPVRNTVLFPSVVAPDHHLPAEIDRRRAAGAARAAADRNLPAAKP